MATDCKSVGFPFGGSNPPLPTNKTDVFLHIRFVVGFGGENGNLMLLSRFIINGVFS